MYSHYPKQNNYHYHIDGNITHLYYQMTEKNFDRHISYCEQMNIIPEVKSRWVEILIDTEDFERIKGWSITLKCRHSEIKDKCKNEFWCVEITKTFNYKTQKHLLHRFILNPQKDMQVDHINHNRFDNRKSQLKIVTHKENQENRRYSQFGSKSGIRGVSKKINNKGTKQEKTYWMARVFSDNKRVFTKYFPYTNEGLKQAKQAVVNARKLYFTNSNEVLLDA